MLDKKQPRILVVDRDLETLTSLDFRLSREGYLVSIRSSFAEALKAVAGQGFDLVIAGTREAENHGLTLAWKIRALSPQTRVLLLLESDGSPGLPDGVKAGAEILLKKPYTEPELLERVERLLGVASS